MDVNPAWHRRVGGDPAAARQRLPAGRVAPFDYDEDSGEQFVAESGATAYVTKSVLGPEVLEAVWSRAAR